MNRRAFLTAILATAGAAAVPKVPMALIAEPLAPGIGGAIVGPPYLACAQIRDLLLPGLYEVRGSYSIIPRQWARVFAEQTRADNEREGINNASG